MDGNIIDNSHHSRLNLLMSKIRDVMQGARRSYVWEELFEYNGLNGTVLHNDPKRGRKS